MGNWKGAQNWVGIGVVSGVSGVGSEVGEKNHIYFGYWGFLFMWILGFVKIPNLLPRQKPPKRCVRRFRELMENTLAILGHWPDKNRTKKNFSHFGKLGGDGNFVGRSFRHFEWKKWVWKTGGIFFYFDNIYIS